MQISNTSKRYGDRYIELSNSATVITDYYGIRVNYILTIESFINVDSNYTNNKAIVHSYDIKSGEKEIVFEGEVSYALNFIDHLLIIK